MSNVQMELSMQVCFGEISFVQTWQFHSNECDGITIFCDGITLLNCDGISQMIKCTILHSRRWQYLLSRINLCSKTTLKSTIDSWTTSDQLYIGQLLIIIYSFNFSLNFTTAFYVYIFIFIIKGVNKTEFVRRQLPNHAQYRYYKIEYVYDIIHIQLFEHEISPQW